MLGYILQIIILTIFVLIIFHFIIQHTKKIWYIDNNRDYDASYKKIVKLLNSLPDDDLSQTSSILNKPQEVSVQSQQIKDINLKNSMEIKLSEYITNIT